MSDDLRDQFDVMIKRAGRAASLIVLSQERREAEQLIVRRCGNCCQWMAKRYCPLEAAGQKPSSGHSACPEYDEKPWVRELYETRIAGIESKLKELATPERTVTP